MRRDEDRTAVLDEVTPIQTVAEPRSRRQPVFNAGEPGVLPDILESLRERARDLIDPEE